MMRKAGNIFSTLLIIVLVGILAWSGYNAFHETDKYREGNKTYKNIAKEATKEDGNLNWKKLKKINPDVAAWIRMPQKDGFLNYPVVHCSSNEKYLHTLFNGAYGACGTLFIDKHNKPGFSDFNTIIYGHHMGRWFYEGPMFGKLERYRKQSYYNKHSWMWIFTPKQTYKMEIVASYTTPGISNKMAYRIRFGSSDKAEKWLSYTNKKSLIRSKYDYSALDHFVTLSTCAYDYSNERFVVVGKIVKY